MAGDLTKMIYLFSLLFLPIIFEENDYLYDIGDLLAIDRYGPFYYGDPGSLDFLMFQRAQLLKTRPRVDEKIPTNVSVAIKLKTVGDLDERTNDFVVDIELAQKWEAPKMAFGTIFPNTQWPGKFLDLEVEYLYRRFWTPGTYFVNESPSIRSSKFRWLPSTAKHTLTTRNTIMRVTEDGSFLFVERLTMKLTCNMDLRNYPMDRQVCAMKISSYPHTAKEVVYKWNDEFGSPVIFKKEDMSLAEYEIVQIDTSEDCETLHRTEEHSCIKSNIHIRRRLGSYLMQFYFPPIFFVVLSWGAFWIDIDAVVARFGYGVFLLVNMAAQMLFALRRLPPVAYIKAMDIWMATCLVFICGAMLEYAFIKVKLRNVAIKTGRRMSSFFPKVSSSEEEEDSDSSGEILEVPAVTGKKSEDYIELPAVTTNSSGRKLHKTESDDYIELPAITTQANPRASAGGPGMLRPARRSTTTAAPKKTVTAVTVAPAEEPRGGKLSRNATFIRRLEYRLRKKIRKLKTNEALMIDIISRFVFPIAFCLFNLGYWSYYLSSY